MTSWPRLIEAAVDTIEAVLATMDAVMDSIEAQTALLSFDDVVGGLVTIPSEHKRVHDGWTFFVDRFLDEGAELGDDASMDLWVSVPAGVVPHMTWGFWSGGLAQSYVYENPTVSAEGTAVTRENRNRNSVNAAATIVKHTPTVSNAGTRLHGGTWHGSADIPGPEGPGDGGSRAAQELELKSGNTYLFRITARTASILAGSELNWYEE